MKIFLFIVLFSFAVGNIDIYCALLISQQEQEEVLKKFELRHSASLTVQPKTIESFCLGREFSLLKNIHLLARTRDEEISLCSKLMHCGVFSEITFEEKIYNLLTESEKLAYSKIEDACVFLICSGKIFQNDHIPTLLGKSLINLPSKINQRGFSGRTILLIISDAGEYRDYFDFKKRSSQKESETKEANNITASCRLLLENGALLSVQDKRGLTALHIAVAALNVPLSALYIENNANLDLRDEEERMPLHCLVPIQIISWINSFRVSYAVHSPSSPAHRREDILRFFLGRKVNIDSADGKGNTLLHRSVADNDRGIAALLIRKGAAIDCKSVLQQTPLHYSCKNGNGDLTGLLIKEGARVEVRDCFGNFPIHYASISQLCLELFQGRIDHSIKSESGWQPIHFVCYFSNNVALLSYLISQGADVNAKIRKSGKTGLMIACERGERDLCMELLRQPSLDVLLEDKILGTAFDWACEFEHLDIGTLVLENQNELTKAKLLNSACRKFDHQLIAAVFVKSKETLRRQDADGNTILHVACLENFDVLVEFLLQNFDTISLGVNLINKQGKTPRECALSTGNRHIVKTFKNHQIST